MIQLPCTLRAWSRSPLLVAGITLGLILAACGGDDSDDDLERATDPHQTATEIVEETLEESPTTEPNQVVTKEAHESPGEPTVEPETDPTPTDEPTPQPEAAEDVDLAPELVGLTDWRNGEPVSLEDLRGEPVVLVFWNSM